MALASLEQVAHVLNLSPRRVQQLVKDHGMPRISRGEYDLVKCVHWFIAFLTNRLEETRRGSSETESQARARYMAAIADLRQMDVFERAGQLISVEDAINLIAPVLTAFKTKIMSVPRRISIMVSPGDLHERIRIESLVDGYVRTTLEDISNIPVRIEAVGARKREKWSGAQVIGPKGHSPKSTGKKVGNSEET